MMRRQVLFVAGSAISPYLPRGRGHGPQDPWGCPAARRPIRAVQDEPRM